MSAQVPSYIADYTDDAPQGYYLLSVHTPGDTAWLIILDNRGDMVCYKPFPAVGINFNFSLWPNGWMAYSGLNKFYLLDSAFNQVDSVTCKNNYAIDLHEFQILPNNHYLLLGLELIKVDLSKYQWKDGYGSKSAWVKCGVVQEQDSLGQVTFEWHAKNYYAFGDVDSFFLKPDKNVVDLMHFNSAAIGVDGNILVSARNYNEITKIDRKSGQVMWRFGGGRNEFNFINCPVPFFGQHDVRQLKNGNITMFEGGDQTEHHTARALEFKLDEVSKTATLVWSFTFDTSTRSVGRGGNVQQLENNKRLIDYGDVMGKNICFLVLDSTNKMVFQLKFAGGLGSYRTLHYAELPWQLSRPQISCFDSAGVTYLDAGAGYTQFKWSTGQTSRVIQATGAGSYHVFVPYGDGGFISSPEFRVVTYKKAGQSQK